MAFQQDLGCLQFYDKWPPPFSQSIEIHIENEKFF